MKNRLYPLLLAAVMILPGCTLHKKDMEEIMSPPEVSAGVDPNDWDKEQDEEVQTGK